MLRRTLAMIIIPREALESKSEPPNSPTGYRHRMLQGLQVPYKPRSA